MYGRERAITTLGAFAIVTDRTREHAQRVGVDVGDTTPATRIATAIEQDEKLA